MKNVMPTDQDIDQRIRDLFATVPRLNPADVRVQVADGHVELSGFVMTAEERVLAGELAAAERRVLLEHARGTAGR